MGKYGIVTELDETTLDWTLEFVVGAFPTGPLRFGELGVARCDTSRAMIFELTKTGRTYSYEGFDPWTRAHLSREAIPAMLLHEGEATDLVADVADDWFHWLFVDGCHDYSHVAEDFLLWKRTVRRGGLMLFHDTTEHTDCNPDYWQGFGRKGNPLRHVAVRRALTDLGLYDGRWNDQFELVRDTPGPFTSGGITAWRRR